MQKKKINVVIIGAGTVVLKQHAPVLAKFNAFHLSVVVTRSAARWKQIAAMHPETRHCSDLSQLLKSGCHDKSKHNLAIICTPSHRHLPEALALLKKGFDLLIEKPVTINSREAVRIQDAAGRAGRKVYAFHNRHYDADMTTIQKIMAADKIGKIFHVEIHLFNSFGSGWGNYGVSDWRISGLSGGMNFDWGAHFFEHVLTLFPSGIRSVYARLEKRGNFKKVDDHNFVQIISKSGQQALVSMSNLVPGTLPTWFITGTKGAIKSIDVRGWNWNKFILTTVKNGRIKDTEIAPKAPVKRIDDCFYADLVKEIQGKKGSLKVRFKDAIHVMKIIDAAFQSSKLGRPVFLRK